jgi:hypothetical protein
MNTLVGFLTVDATKTQRYGEYAGAGETWELDARRVELHCSGGHWVCGKRPGTRTASWFQNRIGATLGSNNLDETPVRGFYGVQYDRYEAGRLYAEGRLTLADGWEAEYRGEYSTGKPMYRIQRVGEAGQ